MEITFTAKGISLSERFRDYVESKIVKFEQLSDRIQYVEVKVRQENPNRGANSDMRVELTLIGAGPTVRSEATGGDKFGAFDIAFGKVLERLRRAKDRRSDRHARGKRVPLHDAAAAGFAHVDITPASNVSLGTGPIDVIPEETEETPYTPVVIRRKEFKAEPMTLDDALYFMEMVGHDFYLYIDAKTDKPSVVYRRRGWDYGVITLSENAKEPQAAAIAKSRASS